MNESNNNSSLAKNIGPILLILGIVAVFLSYWLVYRKYDEKTTTVKDEIKTLEARRNDLRTLDAGKKAIQEKTEAAEKVCDKVLAEFDGDVAQKQIIMDIYNITQDVNQKSGKELLVPKLELSEATEPYVFGGATDAEAGTDSTTSVITGGSEYTTKDIQYTVTTYGDYEQLKETLRDYIQFDKKRKVVNNIQVTFDTQYNLLKTEITVDEYAVLGEGRELTMPDVPQYDMSATDIFLRGEALAQ